MTDTALVKNELSLVFNIESEKIEKYDSIINYAVCCINVLINEGSDENDLRIVHLCAAKAFYQIAVLENDGVKSFSAGEVSYETDACAFLSAKEMLDDAMKDCNQLLKSNDFDFKAV